MILQHKKADDYVIATGNTNSVRDFVITAFMHAGINIIWKGTGLKEVGINEADCQILIEFSEHYIRPFDVELLVGDYSKAKKILGWTGNQIQRTRKDND